MEKALLKDLRSAKDQIQYDTCAKQILGNRYVLAWILKETVEEFRGVLVEQIVGNCLGSGIEISGTQLLPEKLIGDNTESAIPNEGAFTYDIRFHACAPYMGAGKKCGKKNGKRHLKLLFDMEAQKNYYPGYEIVTRGIFYGARMISEQVYTEFTPDGYNDIKKVYSIWICMNSPSCVGNAVSRFEMTKSDLIRGIPDKRESYDKLTVVQISLNRNVPDRPGSVTRLLNVIFSEEMPVENKIRILAEEFGITPDVYGKEEFDGMCNLGEGIYERGIMKGIKTGELDKTRTVIRNMLNRGMAEEDICALAECTRELVHEVKNQ